uniref:Uncharacterized protein n=1 Tax=Sym plasmid TaxID=28430 RepID=A0A515HIR5_9ZZZZ|nr:hypothetical protein pTL43_00034 [Sym plasmid]
MATTVDFLSSGEQLHLSSGLAVRGLRPSDFTIEVLAHSADFAPRTRTMTLTLPYFVRSYSLTDRDPWHRLLREHVAAGYYDAPGEQ